MKRLFAIGLSLLMLVGFSTNAVAISDSDKESYLKWIKKHGAGWSYALAAAPNGCGWYDSGSSIYEAKRKALTQGMAVSMKMPIVPVIGYPLTLPEMIPVIGS